MSLVTRLATTLPATLGFCAAMTGIATACAFHSYAPEETVVDKMLYSDHIVLARADPDDPLRYKPVKAIVGSTQDVELPQQMDSATRQRLAIHPEDKVLFAREGSYGPWQRLAYLDQDYGRVIGRIAGRLQDWQYGGDEERFQIFADLHAHPNLDLRVLALKELDRAPYGLLHRLKVDPDANEILQAIKQPEMAEFQPIHILLLGLSRDEIAHDALESGLQTALSARSGGYIGAWATAFIEESGAEGVRWVASRLHDDASLMPDTRESLIEALAIHAQTGPPDVQAVVGNELQRLLDDDASYGGMVARQLGGRGDWSQAENLGKLLKSGSLRTADAVISVGHYFSLAQAEQEWDANSD